MSGRKDSYNRLEYKKMENFKNTDRNRITPAFQTKNKLTIALKIKNRLTQSLKTKNKLT